MTALKIYDRLIAHRICRVFTLPAGAKLGLREMARLEQSKNQEAELVLNQDNLC
jgi:hypothetical protein